MKRYHYCSCTVLFITIHYYYTVIVVLLNEFQANFHLDIPVIFKTSNNKPWKGDTLVSKQVIQIKPGEPVLSWSDKCILYLLKCFCSTFYFSFALYGWVCSSLDTYCCYQQPSQFQLWLHESLDPVGPSQRIV